MLIDTRSMFADRQTLTATGNSTDTIDLVDAPRLLGPGRPVYVCVLVHAADASGTNNETYAMALETAASDAFSPATTIATLNIPRDTEDRLYVLGFPFDNQRHLRLRTTIAGADPSLEYSAWLTDQEPQMFMAYASPSQA